MKEISVDRKYTRNWQFCIYVNNTQAYLLLTLTRHSGVAQGQKRGGEERRGRGAARQTVGMGVANVCLGRMGPHSEPRQRKKVGNTHKRALYRGVVRKGEERRIRRGLWQGDELGAKYSLSQYDAQLFVMET